MSNYVITFNEVDKGGLCYENISGESPKDAVERRFDRKMRRVYGDEIEWANVIVRQGKFDSERNCIVTSCGNGASYGYIVSE